MAKIAINNLTSVDYALIDNVGRIIGNSFNVSVTLSGTPTTDEHVVVDFGTAKKDIKALIDHPQTGFDHKLWVDPKWVEVLDGVPDTVYVDTPYVNLALPKDAITICAGHTPPSELLEAYLNDLLPYDVEVHIDQTPNCVPEDSVNDWSHPVMFRYVHGLKDSTSWGCQNIAHGHQSFFQILHDERFHPKVLDELLCALRNEFDQAIFIKAANLQHNETNKNKTVTYVSRDRGSFVASFKYTGELDVSKLVVTTSETTIEFLVELFALKTQELCEEMGIDPRFIKAIFVSEGLNKGALYEF